MMENSIDSSLDEIVEQEKTDFGENRRFITDNEVEERRTDFYTSDALSVKTSLSHAKLDNVLLQYVNLTSEEKKYPKLKKREIFFERLIQVENSNTWRRWFYIKWKKFKHIFSSFNSFIFYSVFMSTFITFIQTKLENYFKKIKKN